jgi:hypothetical protein
VLKNIQRATKNIFTCSIKATTALKKIMMAEKLKQNR